MKALIALVMLCVLFIFWGVGKSSILLLLLAFICGVLALARVYLLGIEAIAGEFWDDF